MNVNRTFPAFFSFLIAVVLFCTALHSARAGQPAFVPGKCYPGNLMFVYITKKLANRTYEIHSTILPSPSIYKSLKDIPSARQIYERFKIIGEQKVMMNNGFAQKLAVFQECRDNE